MSPHAHICQYAYLCWAGSAMLEIMYDISPGSTYKFNTAALGEQVRPVLWHARRCTPPYPRRALH